MIKENEIIEHYSDEVLVKVEDENGEHKLTSIPNFSRYKADLKRGRIYSVNRKRFLVEGKPNYHGYVYTTLISDDNDAVPISVHVLMMSAHTGRLPASWRAEELELDHIDGCKHNNNIDNLRLVTRAEQYCERVRAKMSANHQGQLNELQVKYIRYFKAIIEAKGQQVTTKHIHYLADKYGRKYETIRNVLLYATHKDVKLDKAMLKEVRKIELQHDLEQLELSA